MGDTVIALPAFHLIRRKFPDSQIALLTNVPEAASAAPLMSVLGADTGLINDVIEYQPGEVTFYKRMQLFRAIRKCRADILIYLMPVRSIKGLIRDWLFFRLTGIHNIIGFPVNNDQRFSRRDPVTGKVEAEARRLERCLSELGGFDLNKASSWSLKLHEKELAVGRQAIARFTGKFIAIHMGGKSSEKDWGVDNWTQLLTRLQTRLSVRCLLIVGAQEDVQRACAVSRIWGSEVVNVCGLLSPRETAAAISHAFLFLGHDSGPLHLASCTGIPAVGIFGDYNMPEQWHPLSQNTRVVHEMSGIDTITVQQVLDCAEDVLVTSDRHVEKK